MNRRKTEQLEPQQTWDRRNNSSSVSGILNSELHEETDTNSNVFRPRKRTLVSNHCYKPLSSRKKVSSCGECYCTRSPVRSKFDIKFEEEEPEIPIIPRYTKASSRYRYYGCNSDLDDSDRVQARKCNFVLPKKAIPVICEPNFRHSCRYPRCKCTKHSCCLSKRRNKGKNTDTPTQVYERFKKPEIIDADVEADETDGKIQTKNSPKLIKKGTKWDCNYEGVGDAPLREGIEFLTKSHLNSTKPSPKVFDVGPQTDVYTEDEEPDRIFFKSVTDARANLEKLNTFRKENYFDCHSSEVIPDLSDTKHKCVHKFVLNERLIPQPLNVDPFGMSRCIKCNKPLKSEMPSLNKKENPATSLLDRRQKKLAKNPNPLERKMPNQINITGKNEMIEFKIPFNMNTFLELFGAADIIEIKKPVPKNSIALRYQKGVA